jgi:hypothetical protein
MVTQHAFRLVRADLSDPHTGDCLGEIRRWAPDHGYDLRGIDCSYSDASYPLLIATLRPSGISAVAVPSLAHVAGWMDALRTEVEVWTMHPLHRWPHHRTSDLSPQASPQFRRRE